TRTFLASWTVSRISGTSVIATHILSFSPRRTGSHSRVLSPIQLAVFFPIAPFLSAMSSVKTVKTDSAACGRERERGLRPGPRKRSMRATLSLAAVATALIGYLSGVAEAVVSSNGTSEGSILIIGGTTASATTYPYATLLQITLPVGGNSSLKTVTTCTGSLIQASPVPVVVTAAHCGSSGEEKYAMAYVGRGDMSVSCDTEASCAAFQVTSIIVNPAYNASS
ncbi:hypothetical protein HDU93_005331, partial [Gonapodya sp. JEL0774]